jgi:hypothetical protein
MKIYFVGLHQYTMSILTHNVYVDMYENGILKRSPLGIY